MSLDNNSTTTPARPGTRPQRSPPRNFQGDIICTHNDCKDNQPKFKRLCEYNKHMDKHERPYKCSNPACKKNPGFTYAGGLLRHQREVHSMHRTKDPFFCPHPSCNRSAGAGFSRRENLDEHLRRRHSGISAVDDSTTTTAESPAAVNEVRVIKPLAPLPPDRKRRADANPDDEERGLDYHHPQPSTSEPHQEIQILRAQITGLQSDNQRIRAELSHRDQLLDQLSQENKRLRGMIGGTSTPTTLPPPIALPPPHLHYQHTMYQQHHQQPPPLV